MGIDPEPPLVGSDECLKKAAGEALTVKKVPHWPGTTPALGLRAGNTMKGLDYGKFLR
jgi:hypothetical protein